MSFQNTPTLLPKIRSISLIKIIFLGMSLSLILSVLPISVYLFFEIKKDTNYIQDLIIKMQVETINEVNEDARVYHNFHKYLSEIWKLGIFNNLVLVDKNCKILAQIPLNLNNLPTCEEERLFWSFLEIKDDVGGIHGIYYKIQGSSILNNGSLLSSFLLSLLMFLFLFSLMATFWIKKMFNNPLKKLSERILTLNKDDPMTWNTLQFPIELEDIYKALMDFQVENLSIKNQLAEQTRILAIAEISGQVSHDIRSPLASLNMATRDLSQIPEERRLIIRGSINRIQDIANTLLTKQKEMNLRNNQNEILGMGGKSSPGTKGQCSVQDDNQDKMSPYLLSILVEEIISEKRMQFKSKMGIEIISFIDADSYGLFACIQGREFRRVLSNLINNSIEAFCGGGKVTIGLEYLESDNGNKVILEISDNGKGIPEAVLDKLGQLGNSYGKEDGNGLGIYHAKKVIEKWKGDFHIQSKINEGTTIRISLPKASPPSWFLEKLDLIGKKYVVILDDDMAIHQIWDSYFSRQITNESIELFHFLDPHQFIKWFKNFKEIKDLSTFLFLFDFELLGFETNGLEVIERLNISHLSVLVTSRYEEKEVLSKCNQLNIKLIPKMLAEFVPLIDSETFKLNAIAKLYDICHIDDDEFLRFLWQKSANSKGINLLSVQSFSELEQNLDLFSSETSFYIDRELGKNELKGEEIAKYLFQKGFKNVHLSTGYEACEFTDLTFLKGVVGKEPPWDLDNNGPMEIYNSK